jgi:hypothetical protein
MRPWSSVWYMLRISAGMLALAASGSVHTSMGTGSRYDERLCEADGAGGIAGGCVWKVEVWLAVRGRGMVVVCWGVAGPNWPEDARWRLGMGAGEAE